MVLNTDNQGFIINEGNIEKIPKKLLSILEQIVTFSKNELSDNFLSAYVRGSVATGRFIDNISDIDFVAVSKSKPHRENFYNFLNYSLELDKNYPWVKGFDLFLIDEETLFKSLESNKLRVYLSTESVLLNGDNTIAGKLKKYRPDKILADTLLSEIDNEFLFLKNIFSSDKQDFFYNNQVRSLDFWCIWMSRVVLRFSLYASLGKHHSYTNDLKDCYKIVSKLQPELEPDLKLALIWSQTPINNRYILSDYFERIIDKIKKIKNE